MPDELRPGFDILGLGMSVLDSLQGVEEFPAGGGVTEVGESALMGGGPVPTALCAAARLGAQCAILDRVGDDWRGEAIRRDYERFGVDVGFLAMEPGKRSTFANVLVRRRDGERHILFEPGDFTPLVREEPPLDALRACRVLHLNGRHWPACVDAASLVRESGGSVSFDGGAQRFEEKYRELLPRVDILIVARDFAEKLAGSSEREAQLKALGKWGAKVAGFTDGAEGSWWILPDGEMFHQPAFAIDGIMDTTGCGDVFHGAFLYAWLKGDGVAASARFASAAAALSAIGLGGRGSLPRLEEVEEL